MLVLGFDTATPAVSVALHDGDRVVAQAFAVDARRHSELLMPMITAVMADAGGPRYDAAGCRVTGPAVGPASAIPDAPDLPVAGAGGELYPAAFGALIGPQYPDAATLGHRVATALATRAQAQGPSLLLAPEPLYLRRPGAREPGPPKRVTPA